MGLFSGLGSALVGGALSFLGGERSNAQSQANAEAQMSFQDRMSSTAYQRSMADMRAAGLNPILAYKTGGASAPAGAAAPVANALGDAVSSARQWSMFNAELDKVEQEAETGKSAEALNRSAQALNETLEKKALVDTAVSAEQQRKVANDASVSHETALNLAIDNLIKRHQVTSAAGEARIKTREAEDTEHYGTSQVGRTAAGVERTVDRAYDYSTRQLMRLLKSMGNSSLFK